MSDENTKSDYRSAIIGLLVAAALLGAFIWRLPVNGWGSLLWFAVMAGMSIIRIPHEQKAKKLATNETRQGRVENLLLLGVTLGAALIPAIHLATGLFGFADYPVPAHWPFLGLLLAAPGLWLFYRSHADLGKNWSVSLEIRKDHGLITHGVYSRIRHPMYTAIFLLYTAQAVFIHNWIAGLSGLMTFGLMYLIRAPIEEAMMREQFGQAYDEYCSGTGRLWPKLSK